MGPLLDRQDGSHILGQDGAASIAVDNGSLWVFADTFYGQKKDGGGLDVDGAVTNNAAWSTRGDENGGIPKLKHLLDSRGRPANLIALDKQENARRYRIWPGHGIQIGQRIYLFYSLVVVFGRGAWDFRHEGQGLAVRSAHHKQFVRLRTAGRYLYWRHDQPRFGTAVLQRGGGWVYIYGRSESGDRGWYVARVLPNFIDDIRRYEYYVGTTEKGAEWDSNLDRARPLFADGPPEASVVYNAALRRLVMLYSRFLEKDVVLRTASEPWGPWSAPQAIYQCRALGDDASCYGAKEHPELTSNDGWRTYFTLIDGHGALGGLPLLFELDLKSNFTRLLSRVVQNPSVIGNSLPPSQAPVGPALRDPR